ncbi:hypothetical protein BJY01DRAFT_58861 [Aspergillus pseudoustus]|uniref:Uncharacterized protein n=1 Tax=Aspergillus pseudoustus TaxID=1810923 RepID=A0ABR4J9E7_9EURO
MHGVPPPSPKSAMICVVPGLLSPYSSKLLRAPSTGTAITDPTPASCVKPSHGLARELPCVDPWVPVELALSTCPQLRQAQEIGRKSACRIFLSSDNSELRVGVGCEASWG